MPDNNISSFENNDTVNTRPELSPEPIDKRPLIIGIVVAFVFLLGSCGFGILLHRNPIDTAILRDIFIIYLGIGSFVIILLIIALVVITTYLVLKVNDLVVLLDREIKPMLAQVQSSLNTVKGTTNFISDQAVQPIIKTAGAVTAVQTVVKSLFKRN